MKLRIISMIVLSVAILTLVWHNFATADSNGCSKATLQGSFGFYQTGFTPDGPLAAIGIVSYDGKGNNHGRQTISRNGVFKFLEFDGTYAVNPDCTIDGGAIIVDDGNELYNLSRTSGNAVYVVSRKIQ